MWVVDLIIQKRRLAQIRKIPSDNPNVDRPSKLKYLDIDGFLKRQKMRRIKERK